MINRKTKYISAAIFAIAVIAAGVWFGRDTKISTAPSAVDLPAQADEPSAVLSAQPGRVEEAQPESVDDSSAQLVSNDEPAESMPSDGGVRTIFSAPDFGTDAFRQASQESSTYLANYNSPWSNSMVFKADSDALRDLMKQVESSPDGLLDAFDVSPIAHAPCVMTAIKSTSPRFTAGVDDPPAAYEVSGKCEASSTLVGINFLKEEGAYKITLISSVYGAYTVKSLGDWGYALVFRNDDFHDPRNRSPSDAPVMPFAR